MICFKSSKWACLNNWSFLTWIFHITTQRHNSGYPSVRSVNPTLHPNHQPLISNRTLYKRVSRSRSLPILYGRMSQKVPEDWFSNGTITQESFWEVILMSKIILSFSRLKKKKNVLRTKNPQIFVTTVLKTCLWDSSILSPRIWIGTQNTEEESFHLWPQRGRTHLFMNNTS